MSSADALNDAVTVFRDPARVAELRSRALADDVVLVLRVAAGDQAAVAVASERTGLDAEELFEAAIFYLQQILFGPNANAYRILGCPIDATQQRLKENYRWLIKWLHPDRNRDQWESVYADKVNIAWQSLKTPTRRERYDTENGLDGLQLEAASTGLAMQAAVTSPVDDREVLLSGALVHHLPAITLSIMGLGAVVLLALVYWVNSDAQSVAMPTIAQSERVEIERAPAAPASPTLRSIAAADGRSIDGPNASQAQPADSELDQPDSDLETIENSAVAPETVASSHPGLSAPDEAAHDAIARLLAAGEGQSSSEAVFANTAANDEFSPALPAGLPEAVGEPPVTSDVATERAFLAESPASAGSLAGTNADPALTGSKNPSTSKAPTQLAANQVALSVASVPTPTPTPTPGGAAQGIPQVRPGAATSAALNNLNSGSSATAVTESRAPLTQQRSILAARLDDTAAAATPAVRPPPTLAVAPRDNIRRMGPMLPPLERAPSATQAAALVEDFASAYTAGDLLRFDRLFSGSVTKHSDLNGLRDRMQEAQMRFLELADVRWEMDTETAIGYARYRETFVPEGERKAVTRVGDLHWVIRMNGSQPRIAAISVKASPR